MTALRQIFPPTPAFTDQTIPGLTGKTIIITGGTSGVGYHAASLLYAKHATVYIAARSAEKAQTAIATIQSAPECTHSRGRLAFLALDLSELRSIKRSVEEFLRLENRLDILVHNAGVMTPPAGSKTSLGHDLEMSTNCLGPFLFNQLLLPTLQRTAASAEPGSVRVVWVASLLSAFVAHGGIVFDEESGAPTVLKNVMENYMQSKVGNVFLASEMARRVGGDGVMSLSVNPGLMKTELQRHNSPAQGKIMGILFKGPRYGAYSELFAALSPEVTPERNGAFVIPWGRFGTVPCHIEKGLASERDGGTGAAERFWGWCERETAAFR
ncbi:NAD(P)-binding protein [Aspergillus violaceofuscus CBS 115571]|uniref:NAD(P)-binding protein n=1 Tax=Aspergillus violaceofuscus (strain CBS 115571) TaxID=1450538 RepID=A0A2V5HIC5_ASPV1|nr:NAD(P)-binding protein [Aspergillus violaceofuscus CBS 115571]